MSDDKKINWHPPMELPPEEKTNFLGWKNPIQIFGTQQTCFVPLETPTFMLYNRQSANINAEQKKYSPTVLKLHSGWAKVMEEEAKNHAPFFEPDPNISKDFFDKIEAMAKRLNINAEDLAAIIYLESHFDPQVSSSSGKYHGLIQMDKKTFDNICKSSGITYEQYCKLSREKQLKYTEIYLKYRIKEAGLKGKVSGAQIYALIHRPADVNKKSELMERQRRINRAKNIFNKYSKHIDEKC